MKNVKGKIYWRRKSDSKQQTMFDDTPLVKLNIRRNSSTERRMTMETEIILEEKASWVDEYKELILAGWGWEKAAYIAWASTPKKLRKCIHQITVEHYGLHKPDTLGIFIGRQTRNG